MLYDCIFYYFSTLIMREHLFNCKELKEGTKYIKLKAIAAVWPLR
jgi:hypothetical protein